ncbi:MAG: hypothetical protein FJX68_01860 [Alphaproteobacteria bacterium]|nr:hypothetical protein [Alphaproteobacteria bacterium]
MRRTAADVLVETLRQHGVDRLFCVPGESYLEVLNAIRDQGGIRVVTCRHEAGAAFMAAADAKATGRTGVCFASRGPGGSNAMIALHAAEQDALPVVLFLGHLPRARMGTRGFQEIDAKRTFGDIAKWVEEVQQPERLPQAVARAFHKANTGTPGPVVVVLPTDLLPLETAAEAAQPRSRPRQLPAESEVAAVADRLASAQRPLLIAGGLCRSEAARASLLAVAERWGLPVMPTFENPDIFPNGHANYAGELGLRPPAGIKARALEADLVLAVGSRLPELPTQGFTIPSPRQSLIQVHPDPDQLGHQSAPEIGLAVEPAAFLAALARHNAPPASPERKAWIAHARGPYVEAQRYTAREAADGVDFGCVIAAMNKLLPEDAIVTSDAGSFASWMHRHYQFHGRQILLGASSGAMGFGVPAAVAAALRFPERAVLALIGDGGMLMTGYELATAVKERARLILVVANNRDYATIRFHQEVRYPGRPYATELTNPDFAALARAFGAKGLSVDSPSEAEPVLREALAHDGPVVIDVATSLELITANTSISSLRAPR